MFNYNLKAITFKNIKKFSYEIYNNLSVNFLKNTNDSSLMFRFVDALSGACRELADDLSYMLDFALTGLDYVQIDRVSRFALDNIQNIDLFVMNETVICNSIFLGYSKYTNDFCVLQSVDTKNDFLRHSYPCGCFITGSVATDGPISLSLVPNLWTDVKRTINKTAITVRPTGTMNESTIDLLAYVVVVVSGINIRNEYIEEEVLINYWSEFVTENEFIFIDKIKCINSNVVFDILIYPYINGKEVVWNELLVDREEYDRYVSLVQFDKGNRELVWNILHQESVDFPISYEPFTAVKINEIPSSAEIIDYFIDQPNGLFYVITNENKLYCYTFIIPKSTSDKIDDLKTEYQATTIEYIEDINNRLYSFYIFPTSKTNDVEMLDIYINGNLYEEGIILDLIRENIKSNRIDITFADLFKYGSDALVEIKTSGTFDSNYPIFIKEKRLDPLYIKKLDTIPAFEDIEAGTFSYPQERTTEIGYVDYLSSNGVTISLTPTSKIFKLSSHGNIMVDGYVLTNAFKTFYYDADSNSVVTCDTITNIKASMETDIKFGILNDEDITEENIITLESTRIVAGVNHTFGLNASSPGYIYVVYPFVLGTSIFEFNNYQLNLIGNTKTINEVEYIIYKSPYKQTSPNIKIVGRIQ